MATVESYPGQERRARDRSGGIQLRRRQRKPIDKEADKRRSNDNGFDIAAALELHLDLVTTRRGMIALLETWLQEAKGGDSAERDENYVRAVRHAIQVMTDARDPLAAIAVLQRAPE